MRWRILSIFVVMAAAAPSLAQTAPVNGIRPADLRTHAIIGATVVIAPGRRIENASIVIRGGVIEAVGDDLDIPPEARIWPGDGMTVYPGLIDAALLVDVEKIPDGAGAHWNQRVHPQVRMVDQPAPDTSLRKDLRSLGFTVAAVYPSAGVLRGSGVVVALADEDQHVLAYRERAAMAIGFDHGGSWGSATYPGSLMGAIALVRQTLYDAQWHAACQRVWQGDPLGHEPPIRADALEALGDVIRRSQPVLFDVTDEHNAQRAASIAREFDLDAMFLGSGVEFRRLEQVVATGLPIILPLKYPDRPEVSSPLEADDVTLREMMTWEQAPTNVRRLLDAGATVALTTHRLKKRSDFLSVLRKAIRYGLSEDDALAALTTTPAKLLGLNRIMGTIEAGKVANLVVVEGSLFQRKPKIRDTWINGRRHEVSKDPDLKIVGKATLRTDSGLEAPVDIDTVKAKLAVHLPDGSKVKAKKVVFQHDRLSFVMDGRVFEIEGYVRLAGVLTEGTIVGAGVLPDGEQFTFTIAPSADQDSDAEPVDEEAQPAPVGSEPNGQREADDDDKSEETEDGQEGEGDEEDDEEDEEEDEEEEEAIEPPPEQLVHPLGAFGLTAFPQPRSILITNATIWTCGSGGVIEKGWLAAVDGKITAIGSGAFELGGHYDQSIDGTGKHVTPGLIDCHSHTGVSGGVNEWTQAITSEVRIGDVVNPDDINWYRELAGGLTAANQLHGSANPIGGQNSVVKLKWSGSADDFRIHDAIGGIKFALGENVKRSRDRYPNTRMGVEAIIRDAFTAAGEYQARWDRYRAMKEDDRAHTMPPARDLELDALVEILSGQRMMHCHSYRQDEILMLIRLAEEFGFTIGTFQHVLEGYKVAEAIAAHGAGASTFSDWWAYKVEVMDAIPYNGTLMHDVGVLVSFNSDSSELARRMNTEAAKAVRYGGLGEDEALKFVTINPARQLHIDHRTGSLEVGKDADFVIWSESPLSSYARCEQTWIEGAKYFDLDHDQALRIWAEAERQRLIQKILKDAHGKPKPPQEPATQPMTQPATEPDIKRNDPDPPYSCCWSQDE
ncbi:MAG: amidohydrolase family protein [Planctomycetota bacterium]|nr:amidohydrolase family protein [Planctomycetota bacterium]